MAASKDTSAFARTSHPVASDNDLILSNGVFPMHPSIPSAMLWTGEASSSAGRVLSSSPMPPAARRALDVLESVSGHLEHQIRQSLLNPTAAKTPAMKDAVVRYRHRLRRCWWRSISTPKRRGISRHQLKARTNACYISARWQKVGRRLAVGRIALATGAFGPWLHRGFLCGSFVAGVRKSWGVG
jgi:hypothetical protein